MERIQAANTNRMVNFQHMKIIQLTSTWGVLVGHEWRLMLVAKPDLQGGMSVVFDRMEFQHKMNFQLESTSARTLGRLGTLGGAVA